MLMEMDPLGEDAGRFFINQLIKALETMHSCDIAHRDLKPENIMLDQMLNLKLIDFGLTNSADTQDDVKNLSTFAGTPQYQAPEIISKKAYNGKQTDMFSVGVILFMIVFKSYPFREATKSDRYYKYIYKNSDENFDLYWQAMNSRMKKKGV
jgi:serine/threonine protein kinase